MVALVSRLDQKLPRRERTRAMSRNIDITKPLSDEDREWLEGNGRTDLLRENEAWITGEYDAVIEASTPDESVGQGLDPVNPAVVAQSADPVPTPDQAALLALTAADEASSADAATGTDEAGAGEPDGEPEDEDEDNYDDAEVWTYQDLKDEIKERGVAGHPALNSPREELIAWLRKDDAED